MDVKESSNVINLYDHVKDAYITTHSYHIRLMFNKLQRAIDDQTLRIDQDVFDKAFSIAKNTYVGPSVDIDLDKTEVVSS